MYKIVNWIKLAITMVVFLWLDSQEAQAQYKNSQWGVSLGSPLVLSGLGSTTNYYDVLKDKSSINLVPPYAFTFNFLLVCNIL